jgi:hypothetical protein
MKHLKKYKIFESDSMILVNKIKECFLPVIDVLYDKFEVDASENYAQVTIDIYNNGSDELTNEIIEGIYHLESFDLEVSEAYAEYRKRGIASIMNKVFNSSYNFDIEGELITYISLIDGEKLIKIILYITC